MEPGLLGRAFFVPAIRWRSPPQRRLDWARTASITGMRQAEPLPLLCTAPPIFSTVRATLSRIAPCIEARSEAASPH